MSAPSKPCNIRLVKIQPGERCENLFSLRLSAKHSIRHEERSSECRSSPDGLARRVAAPELNPARRGVTDCRDFQGTDADIGAITLAGGGL